MVQSADCLLPLVLGAGQVGLELGQRLLQVAALLLRRLDEIGPVDAVYLDLHGAWAVVVYNSNCAVDALIAGVPIVVRCPWASTIHMGIHDLAAIESPIYPDNRQPFLYALAERQWTLNEIAAGYAWKALQ